MKRNTLFILAILLALTGCAGNKPRIADRSQNTGAKQNINQISQPSTLGAYRSGVNTELAKAEANDADLYANKVSGQITIYSQNDAPVNCVTGSIWVDTDGVSGSRLYSCESENNWVLQAGGGGGSQIALNIPFTPTGDVTATNVQSAISQVRSLAIAGGVPDAASDGNVYARSNANWISLTNLYQPLTTNLTTWGTVTPSANGRSLVSAADYSSMRTLLSLVPGTNVQAYDADLLTWGGVTPAAGMTTFLGNPSGANLAATLTSALPASKGGTGLTALGTGVTTALGNAVGASGGLQAYDADLTIAAGASNASASTYFGKDSGGTVGFFSLPSGGTGTPGGSTTQIQFNDAGSFGGDSGLTFNKTTDALTVAGALTAGSYASNAANGDRYAEVVNTVTMTATATLGRLAFLTDRYWMANGTNWTTRYLLDSSFIGVSGGVQGYDSTNATTSSTNTFINKSYDVAGTGNNFTDVYEVPITILAPADTDDPIVDPYLNRAVTLTGMACTALGGGTISVDLQECNADSASCATTGATIASCGATRSTDSTLTDTAIASGGSLKLVIGSPSGTVNQVSVKVYGTQVK